MTLYAAYGTNLDPARMSERCPHSPLRTTGWLEGWRLTFGGEEHGWDGALPTIVQDAFEQVFVAIYDVTREDETALDGWESADSGLYRKTKVRVSTLTGEVVAWAYVLDAYEGGLPSALHLGVLADAARALNPGFFSRFERGRPWVQLKMAMSLDGRTAMASGESQWITGEPARADVHRLRARASAVATGIETVLVHPLAGILSAYGIGLAPVKAIREVSLVRPLHDGFAEELDALRDEARTALTEQGIAAKDVTLAARARLRFDGSDSMLTIECTDADAMDAAFRVLISPTPIVGPDRDSKHDNHSNKDFTHEGDELRAFIAKQKNMVVVCGDRHWQYMSVHPKSGVREYSCGPASDQHAGGWKQNDFRKDYHKYLNVTGGFLSGTVERQKDKPTLTFRWHDVRGKVLHTDVAFP